jgi:hypothetical protein
MPSGRGWPSTTDQHHGPQRDSPPARRESAVGPWAPGSGNAPGLRRRPHSTRFIVFSHNKRLQYTVRVDVCNPRMDNLMLEQLGGPEERAGRGVPLFHAVSRRG